MTPPDFFFFYWVALDHLIYPDANRGPKFNPRTPFKARKISADSSIYFSIKNKDLLLKNRAKTAKNSLPL
jgi:hypothetical protein